MRSCSLALLLCFVVGISPLSSKAITIDTFQGALTVEADAPGGMEAGSLSTPFAIGGTRSISVSANNGSGSMTVRTRGPAPYRLTHSQDSDVTGTAVIHWDGDNNALVINPFGLGGIDLTEDGGSAFVLKRVFYDYPSRLPVTLTLTLFDAHDPTGNTSSSAQIVFDSAIALQDQIIPFSAFTDHGSSGPADFTQVGAIVLEIDGTAQATDLEIESITTNGTCPLIPVDPNLGVLDECGACIPLGDPSYNQSCTDCLGTPNGDALPGSACTTTQPGICSAGQYSDQCECDSLLEPTVELCDGLDNDCDGTVDETFPLLGELCGAGEGECAIQGIFVCSSSGGLTCDAEFDLTQGQECDLRIGCDGIPGSSLLQDECGICGGDGSTCSGCDSRDISQIQFALDGGAKFQERLIKRVTGRLLRQRPRFRVRRYAESAQNRAHDLQIRNWVLSWTLPSIVTSCPTNPFCVETSNIGILEEYRAGSEALRDLGLQAIRRLHSRIGMTERTRKFEKRIKRAHKKNMRLADTVPTTQSVCTGILD